MTNKMKLFISPVLGIALIVGGLGLLLFLSGCQTATTSTTNPNIGMGVLEGKVWIGPIPGGPPEKLGLPYPPEIYQPRKIMVYDADHSNLVKQVDITDKGYYSVELLADTYTIDINYVANDWSNEVPRKFTIKPGIHINADIFININAELYIP